MGVRLPHHNPRIAGLDVARCSSRRSSSGGRSSGGSGIHNLTGSVPTAAAVQPASINASIEPIIVTSSWLGAKKRPMGKYADLWRSLGYSHVISARSQITNALVPAAGQRRVAKFTRKLIQTAQHRPHAPILVHLFSGGGFLYMGCVFKILAKMAPHNAQAADVRARICGMVLDSSPANITADVFSRALVAAALARPAEGVEDQVPWLVKPTTAVLRSYLNNPSIRKRVNALEQAWLQDAPPCPKLFLYSSADVLIQPAVVEAFMEQLAAAGSPTFCYKWDDSEHVSHYRKYPEEYTWQLMQFVQRVLPLQQVQVQQQDMEQQVQLGSVGVNV